jgi:phage gp46-like protein
MKSYRFKVILEDDTVKHITCKAQQPKEAWLMVVSALTNSDRPDFKTVELTNS